MKNLLNTNILIITITLFFITTSNICRKDTKDCHYHIKVNNLTNKVLYSAAADNYPDTFSIDKTMVSPILGGGESHRIDPMGITEGSLSISRCYEDDFSNGLLPNKVLMIYIFDENVLRTISWDTLKAKNLYLKRYDLSLEDLRKNNWTITYP